jgi:hypothetical protein
MDGLERLSIGQVTVCQLNPCVKKYSFSIFNGVPSLKSTNSRYRSWYFNSTGLKLSNGRLYNEEDGTSSDQLLGLSWGDGPGENGRLLNPNNTASSSMSFTIGADELFPFQYLESLFAAQLDTKETFAEDKRNRVSNTTGIRFKREFLLGSTEDAKDTSTSALKQIVDHGGLPSVMSRMAAVLSKYFREKDGIPVPGRSYTFVTIVEVRWPWLSLPVVTWVCGTGFLMLTMWTCRGSDQVLWKTSSLPLIYHGFKTRDMEAIDTTADGNERVSGMKKYAKTLNARMVKDSVSGQIKLAMTN